MVKLNMTDLSYIGLREFLLSHESEIANKTNGFTHLHGVFVDTFQRQPETKQHDH